MRRRSNGSGFTLIELLVVIAIIALLVSILVPSLSAARELARRAVCGTALKSVGIGVGMYSQEWAEAVPPCKFFTNFGGADSELFWADKIVQYFDSEARPPVQGEFGAVSSSVGCQPESGNYAVSFGQNPKVRYSRKMSCASQKKTNRYHYAWTYAWMTANPCAWQWYYTADTTGTQWYPIRKLSYYRPADYCTVVEPACQFTAPQPGGAGGDYPYFVSNNSTWVNYLLNNAPHLGTFNGLMLDGHVTNYTTAYLNAWFGDAYGHGAYPFNMPG